MGIIADRLVRSTEANAELWTARPAGERPNNQLHYEMASCVSFIVECRFQSSWE